MNVPIVRNHRGTGRQRRYAGISILQQVWDFVNSFFAPCVRCVTILASHKYWLGDNAIRPYYGQPRFSEPGRLQN